jgi:heme exporter protein A
MELLRVIGLGCARGGIRVLKDVSLALSPGSALVLHGPNGSGKTTLLRTLAGLQPPVAGRVEADPESLAYAAHADGLKPALTARENLEFWARLYGRSGAGTGDALDAFGIGTLVDRRAHDMSAGQKRRLSLARLLVTGRPVWLLDEPTVSLDTEAVGLFAEAVRRHLAGGGAALIATHIDLGLPQAQRYDLAPHRVRLADLADSEAGW